MPSLRFCLRVALGILIAFAGLAVVACADELPTIEFAGPAIAEKPIRTIAEVAPTTDIESTTSEIENVLTVETPVEVVVTEIEIILPIEVVVQPNVHAGPAIAEKPIVVELVEKPIVAETTLERAEVKLIKEPVIAELVEEPAIAEMVEEPVLTETVQEPAIVVLVEEPVFAAPAIAEKPVRIVAERGPAIAEKPASVELDVEIVVVTTIRSRPAVAQAGPHRHTPIAVVAESHPEQRHGMRSNDWISLIAPQISPPAWLVCQWLFAE